MTTTFPAGAPHRNDPLRAARRAVTQGRFREAWHALERTPAETRASAEWQLLAAMAHWRLGDFARSRAAALQARDRFRAMGDADGEMRAENVAAAGGFALGELQDAERGFSRALRMAKDLSDELMIANAAGNLGNVAYYKGEQQTALSLYRLAAATYEKIPSWPGLAMAWINTANVWRDVGDLDASREAADHALEVAERDANDRLVGASLAARAEALAYAGDRLLARAQAERALDLARAESDDLGEADALRILGVIARLEGAYARAEELALEGLGIAERLKNPWFVAEGQRDLGALYHAMDRREDAAARFIAAATALADLGASAQAEQMRATADEVRRG